MRRALRRLLGDRRGVTIVEFGFVAPIMLLTILGLGDLGYQVYAQSVLDGAVQKAGRDSTLESGPGRTTAIDDQVRREVRAVSKDAQFSFSRLNYTAFRFVGPEEFTDSNRNGRRDANECFWDINGNGIYDTEPGRNGQGRAHDVVVYDVTATYPRLFPVASMMGGTTEQTIRARTVLRNQPFNRAQAQTRTEVCPR